MKFYHKLSSVVISVSIIFLQTEATIALSRNKIDKIARKITVLIKNKSNPGSYGSGVIIKRDDGNYAVITVRHVIEKPGEYEIVTPDNKRHSIDVTTKLSDFDLAALRFNSKEKYQVAKIGNSEKIQRNSKVYVAGFPKPTAVIQRPIFHLQVGEVLANASSPSSDGGYALVYNNSTLPGMSGGPVLNDSGEVIGIHGRGEIVEISNERINPRVGFIKSGRNLGIPLNHGLAGFSAFGFNVVLPIARRRPVTTVRKSDNSYIRGVDKFKKKDYVGAIKDFDEAIKLDPDNAPVYLDRGVTNKLMGNNQKADTDLQQAALLFKKQGNTESHHKYLNNIQKSFSENSSSPNGTLLFKPKKQPKVETDEASKPLEFKPKEPPKIETDEQPEPSKPSKPRKQPSKPLEFKPTEPPKIETDEPPKPPEVETSEPSKPSKPRKQPSKPLEFKPKEPPKIETDEPSKPPKVETSEPSKPPKIEFLKPPKEE